MKRSGTAEILDYLRQPSITADDIHRLCSLLETGGEEVVEAASLVLQVALIKPKRSGRRSHLATHRPRLLEALVRAGLDDVS